MHIWKAFGFVQPRNIEKSITFYAIIRRLSYNYDKIINVSPDRIRMSDNDRFLTREF